MEISSQNIDLAEHLLKAGKSILKLQLGIVSYVYENNYELIAIDDISNEFKSGDILHLDKTYCREVVESGKTVAITEIDGVKGLSNHPLYINNTLEAYIGSPIIVDDKIWGTVNFSSLIIREQIFTAAEISLVNSFSNLIADSLAS